MTKLSDEVLKLAIAAYNEYNGPGVMWPSERSALEAMRLVLEKYLAGLDTE